jgi:arginase family enzyme
MISKDVFIPVSRDLISRKAEQLSPDLGSVISMHTEDRFPDAEGAGIAIIGLPEFRGMNRGGDLTLDLNKFRSYFWNLKKHAADVKIVDLGNIIPGATLDDTYSLVMEIGKELIRQTTIPVFIGGSQDLTVAMYRSFASMNQLINMVNIDSRIDLGAPGAAMDATTWLGHLVMEKPNFLFNYSNIGYQSYFVGSEAVDLMRKLYFDTFRLGQVRADISEIEPAIRAADLITTDLSAIRQADGPASTKPGPNGFSGEEMCQAMMYAGLSDRVSALGIFEYDEAADVTGQSAHLMAQMVWYFAEGVSLRKDDLPGEDEENFTRYRVTIPEQEDELVFMKNRRSGRWWIEHPVDGKNARFSRHHYLPCSIRDYEQACRNEVPERWWQAIHKIY